MVLVYHSSALWIHIENLILPRGLCSRVSCRSLQRLCTVTFLVQHHNHLPEIVPEGHKHDQENHNENHQQVEYPHGTHQENTEGRKVELQHLAQTQKPNSKEVHNSSSQVHKTTISRELQKFDNCFQERPQIQVQFKRHGQQFPNNNNNKNQ